MRPTLKHLKKILEDDLRAEGHMVDVYSAQANRQKVKKNSAQQKYLDRLNPFTFDFFIPVHSLFLFEEHNKLTLTGQEYFLVRDGLYPLLNFFHYYPTPEGIKTFFFIHQQLSSFVPEAWKNQVAYYNYETSLKPQKNSELIITGQLNNNFVSLKAFEERLEEIKKLMPLKKNLSALLIHSEDIFIAEEMGLSHIFMYMKALMKNLGTEIQFYNDKQLAGRNLEDFCFADFNENLLTIADSYVPHLLLSKKVAPLFEWAIERFDDDIVIPCSQYHSLRLSFATPSWTKATEEKISSFKKIIGLGPSPERSERYLGLSPDFFLFSRDLAKSYVPFFKKGV